LYFSFIIYLIFLRFEALNITELKWESFGFHFFVDLYILNENIHLYFLNLRLSFGKITYLIWNLHFTGNIIQFDHPIRNQDLHSDFDYFISQVNQTYLFFHPKFFFLDFFIKNIHSIYFSSLLCNYFKIHF
jgi:hypothetical protein